MNIRVVSLVLIILIFALISGALSYSVSSGISLKEAYNTGKITVIQETAAGTVPYEVMITNNGSKTIKVKKGDLLASTISQNLVIAENAKVSPNSNETIKAYSLYPTPRAIVGAKLLPVNNTNNAVNQVISSSNPSDSQSAMNTQLEIWIITSEDNLNPYTGEPAAVVEKQDITWTQFLQDIANAKTDVMTSFNVTDDQIKDLNQTQSNTGQTPQSWINNAVKWIKESVGIEQ